MICLFRDLMMEWNSDVIGKLIDFIENRSFVFKAAAALTMLSAIFLVQETVMNLRQIFVQVSGTSFWYGCRRLN